MLFEGSVTSPPFRQWLLRDRENRLLLKWSAAAILLQFLVFKLFYPFPNFMPPDSYSYLAAATRHGLIDIRAIGYSKFLWLFSPITHAHLALVSFQYLLLEGSLLYFLFSVRYLFSPGIWVFRVLLAINLIDPLIPHIANFVSSDGLFASLSLIWFTQLMWLLYRPDLRTLIGHAILLLLAFTVRYNSLYYPFISLLVIALARALPWRKKWAGIGLILVLLGGFILKTEFEYQRQTGHRQFSAFGGWEMAANALTGYAYAAPDPPGAVPSRFQNLNLLINHHLDSLRRLPLRPDQDLTVYFLWDANSPLSGYMAGQTGERNGPVPDFAAWASVAPLYSAYGRFLIGRHPGPFIKYYLWPNFIKYYSPPVMYMGAYNLGAFVIEPGAVSWFGLKSNRIDNFFHDPQIEVTRIFPVLAAVINLVFFLAFLAFAALGGFRQTSAHGKSILCWMVIIWVSNMVFSVFSAPIELRYQLFPIITTFSFVVLLLAFMVKKTIPSSRW